MGAPPPPPPPAITVGWAGDLTPGWSGGLPPAGGRVQLAPVRDLLQAPDLMIGNLEGTLTSRGRSKCAGSRARTCFAFRAPPGRARALAWAGFDVLNLANNHANDFGPAGRADTVAALRRAGLRDTGAPGQIARVTVRGVRVAVLGFAPYAHAASLLDLGGARRLVRRAARHSDVVVVAMHAGAEGAGAVHVPRGRERAFGEDRGPTRAFAHTVVDAGADLVLGSGPHVIRGMERRSGRPIAYSLGNFAGWRNFGLGGRLSLSGLLEVRVGADGAPQGGVWRSLRLTGPGVPRPDPRGASAALAARLSRQDFGRDAGLSARGRVLY